MPSFASSRVYTRLRDDAPAYGLWIGLTDPAVIEMAANAGYDYVNIDMEHQVIDLSTMVHMIRTAHSCGISAMVRVPENNTSLVLKVADQGPDGIIFPHIMDAEGARLAVQNARYAPLGDRGISGSTRSSSYGAADFATTAERINRELLVWLLIEDVVAVEQIDAITATEGVSVVAPAPADLTRAYGRTGSIDDPLVRDAVERVARSARAAGKHVSLHAGHPNLPLSVDEALALGSRVVDNGVAGPILQQALLSRMGARPMTAAAPSGALGTEKR